MHPVTVAVAALFATVLFATVAALAGGALWTVGRLNRRQAKQIRNLKAFNDLLLANNADCHTYVDAAVVWLARDLDDLIDTTGQEQP